MRNDENVLNISFETKEEITQFNNDFNDRCMQDDTVITNWDQAINWICEHLDLKTLGSNNMINGNQDKKGNDEMKTKEDIRDNVIKFGMANTYNLSESEIIRDDYKDAIDNMFMNYSKDPTITESINHTGFPDDITVMLIELNTGYAVNSIMDFSSIKAVWHDDKYKTGYIFELEMSHSSVSVTIDIDTKEASDK